MLLLLPRNRGTAPLRWTTLLVLLIHAQKASPATTNSADQTALCLQQSSPGAVHGYFDVAAAEEGAGGGGVRAASTASTASKGLTCGALKSAEHFALCDPPPPRECLLARVPWRTPLSVAECCFACCMEHWQRELGLEEIYHTMKNISDESLKTDPRKRLLPTRLLKGLPKLNNVVLQEGSARRFSVARMSPGMHKPWIIPRRDLLERGGVVVVSDGAGLTAGGRADDNLTALVKSYPVSILNQGDIAWPRRPPGSKSTAAVDGGSSSLARLGRLGSSGVSLFDLPRGGSTVTLNAHPDLLLPNDRFLLSFWGVKSLKFTDMLGDAAANAERSNLFMCCCMKDRNGRVPRAADMRRDGLCMDSNAGKVTMKEYIHRLTTAKFVWSPVGHGISTFRDLEIILAGAVPVMDGYAGRKELFAAKFRNLPVIWVPGKNCKRHETHNTLVFCPSINITADWLEEQWQGIVAKHNEWDVAEAFWPYWLYQFSRQIKPRSAARVHDER